MNQWWRLENIEVWEDAALACEAFPLHKSKVFYCRASANHTSKEISLTKCKSLNCTLA